MKPYLRIRRFPYEEPYHLHVVIPVSNGRTSGELEFYTTPDALTSWADHLEVFPRHKNDVFLTEIGSERLEDRWAYYIRFRVFITDNLGHCALHFRFSNNRPLPHLDLFEFCIEADAAAINRLGTLLRGFAKLEHELLAWDLTSGDLFVKASDYE
ncbi:MAG: hypothetical protein WCD79_12885 [Chthoniobacteraceae bacterium]